jgi:hypothetical protein
MEQILTQMLTERFGDNVYIHTITINSKNPGSNGSGGAKRAGLSLQDQLDLMENVKIIVGTFYYCCSALGGMFELFL